MNHLITKNSMYTICQSKTCDEFPHAGVSSLHGILKLQISVNSVAICISFFYEASAEGPHFTHCFQRFNTTKIPKFCNYILCTKPSTIFF